MQMREILEKELDFYYQSFQNISNTCAVLAGFAFGGLNMDPFTKDAVTPDALGVSDILRRAEFAKVVLVRFYNLLFLKNIFQKVILMLCCPVLIRNRTGLIFLVTSLNYP